MRLSYKLLITICLLASPQIVAAQVADPQSDRNAALSEARYLKSIFKIDEAIERLSAFVTPDRFDEEILSELADCHFQNGGLRVRRRDIFPADLQVPAEHPVQSQADADFLQDEGFRPER